MKNTSLFSFEMRRTVRSPMEAIRVLSNTTKVWKIRMKRTAVIFPNMENECHKETTLIQLTIISTGKIILALTK